MSSQIHRYFVTVAKGLEALLDSELQSFGISDTQVVSAGLYFNGTLEDAYKVCLWSRLANRILYPLKEFNAKSPEELYEEIQQLDWSEHMGVNDTLAVDFFSASSEITHTQYGALKVKDAIVDQFRTKLGVRPNVDRYEPSIRINVYLFRNKARLSLDLAGMSLHRRGYRDETTMAPIKENLAAALLLAMNWPERAKQGASFCDPLCGSGTFLIEALMIAADIAPQIKRQYFGFIGWKGHDAESWKALREDAVARARTGLSELTNSIHGSDKSTHVIAQAQKNLQISGFDRYINIRVGNINQINYPKDLKPGLVVCNPPYGVRLEKDADVPKLYTNLGRVFKRQFGGWQIGVFTGSPDLIHRMRLQTTITMKCANGGIDCVLATASPEQSNTDTVDSNPNQSAPTEASSPWSKSSRLSLPEKPNRAEMFANRLAKNFRGLEKWAKGEGVSSYRVYDADLPEYAISVDVYESDKRYVYVQEYRAPSSIDYKVAAQRLQAAISEIPEVLNCEANAIMLKPRRNDDEQPQTRHENHIIEEQGCRFEIDFNDLLDVGMFSHHRKIRRWIFNKAKGKHFLNLFASTGTSSVYAMAAGAASTTTIEQSSRYLQWAERNMVLNSETLESHHFILEDTFSWLSKPPKDLKYDLILLDPPTYTNSANNDQIWEVQRDHVNLIRQAIALLSPDGLLIFTSSSRKFKIDRDRLDWHKITDKSRASIPRDYARTPKIHQCFFIQKKPQETVE